MLRDERRRRLLADAGNAGQAVGGIAAEQREVAVGTARDAVAPPDLRLVDDEQLADARERVEDAHVGIAHEREEVAVARDDVDGARGAGRERRDHVLALEPGGAGHREPERPEQAATERLVGGDRVFLVGEPVRLVGGQRLHPKRRPPVVVDGDGETRGPTVGEQAREHAEEAVYAAHRDGVRQRVEGAVE